MKKNFLANSNSPIKLILKKRNIFHNHFTTVILLFSILFVSCTPHHKITTVEFLPGSKREAVVKSAEKMLGTRYRYGGSDPKGFDCSGLTSYAFRQHGFTIPRTAGEQFKQGRRISIKRAQPGDLVFFRISGSNISHVGMYLGDFRFIHAPRPGKRVAYEDIRKDYWRKRYAGTVTYFR